MVSSSAWNGAAAAAAPKGRPSGSRMALKRAVYSQAVSRSSSASSSTGVAGSMSHERVSDGFFLALAFLIVRMMSRTSSFRKSWYWSIIRDRSRTESVLPCALTLATSAGSGASAKRAILEWSSSRTLSVETLPPKKGPNTLASPSSSILESARSPYWSAPESFNALRCATDWSSVCSPSAALIWRRSVVSWPRSFSVSGRAQHL